MADNRLWLVHKETGWACCIAKRYDNWYVVRPAETGEYIQQFFDLVERDGTIMNDDFCLIHERDGKPWKFDEQIPENGCFKVTWPGEIPSDA